MSDFTKEFRCIVEAGRGAWQLQMLNKCALAVCLDLHGPYEPSIYTNDKKPKTRGCNLCADLARITLKTAFSEMEKAK